MLPWRQHSIDTPEIFASSKSGGLGYWAPELLGSITGLSHRKNLGDLCSWGDTEAVDSQDDDDEELADMV